MLPLNPAKSFNHLGLPDLLEARDLYHVHLMHKDNVIGTAVGRYLIRKSDPLPPEQEAAAAKGKAKLKPKPKRTLDNSEVRPYSWPCILAFVEQWVAEDEFTLNGSAHPTDMVPKALYMPDGRVVPVCVVEAPPSEEVPPPPINLNFPQNLIGGGFPVLADVQGEEHVASVGCLVTDGHLVYALTNRHVSGEAGEPLYSVLGGRRERIGVSTAKQLTRLPFSAVYPSWQGKNVYVNLDIGLIEVDDKNRWTAQVYGVGPLGKMADLSSDTISLRLIGCPVRAYGCASGPLKGEIHALFYRYKSVGGFESVADFLIGARGDAPFGTRPGDSGTLWLLELSKEPGVEKPPPPMPLAVQWGGDVFVGADGNTQHRFALATALSTVCELLDVDVVRDWNTGNPDYWGAVGHYGIANKAVDFVRNRNLKKLMAANLENVSFKVADITKKKLGGLSNHDFVPLADVPDLAWKLGHFSRGQPEHPNHFADMDKPRPDGKTLLDLCRDHPDNVTVPVWQQYYTAVGDSSRGLLPFRVWQIYQEMVKSVKAGDAAGFVCAAGVLSHYVGDACQPLHISYMFNGEPMPDGKTRGVGVHAAYEDGMVDYHTAEIMAGIDAANKQGGAAPKSVEDGHAAAVSVVELMQETFAAIKPVSLVDAFVKAQGGGLKPKGVADALWEEFGAATVTVMTQGCRHLAMLWDSAWKQGNGDGTIKHLDAIDQKKLAALYQDRKFLPSKTIDQIGPLLK